MTPDIMQRAFRILRAGGLKADHQSPADVREAAELYAAMLADAGVAEEQLGQAVRGYLAQGHRSGMANVPWPTPGQLIDLALGTSPDEQKSNQRKLVDRGKALFEGTRKAVGYDSRNPGANLGHFVRHEDPSTEELAACLAAAKGTIHGQANSDPVLHPDAWARGQRLFAATFADVMGDSNRLTDAVAALPPPPMAALPPPPEPEPVADGTTPFPTSKFSAAWFTEVEWEWIRRRSDAIKARNAFDEPGTTQRLRDRYPDPVKAVVQRSAPPAPTPRTPLAKRVFYFQPFHLELKPAWCTPEQVGQPIPDGFAPPGIGSAGNDGGGFKSAFGGGS